MAGPLMVSIAGSCAREVRRSRRGCWSAGAPTPPTQWPTTTTACRPCIGSFTWNLRHSRQRKPSDVTAITPRAVIPIASLWARR